MSNYQINNLLDKIDYLEFQLEQLRKVSVFYENELMNILDYENFTRVVNDCMHMLLLDPHKNEYDEE